MDAWATIVEALSLCSLARVKIEQGYDVDGAEEAAGAGAEEKSQAAGCASA